MTGGISGWLREVYASSDYQPLTRAQEQTASHDELITHNLRLVVSVARKHQGRGVPLEDLIQAGCEGLMTAAGKFDPSRGNKFSTMAVQWIRQSIVRHINNSSRVVRLPAHMTERYNKIRHAYDAFRHEHHRPPSDAEVANLVGMSEDVVERTRVAYRETLSLDDVIADDGGVEEERTYKDVLEERGGTVEEYVIASDDVGCLRRAMKALTPHEQEIVRMKHVDGLSWRTIGEAMGVSREYVRPRGIAAIEKLRVAMSQ